VLAGRDVVADDAEGAVRLDLVGGTEVDRLIAQPTEVPVNELAVREILGTALFSARTGGLGWAHRTFGEYLAAFWLSGSRLSDAQVSDLLLVDDGTERRVTPALRNVAGWLLALRPGFQRTLVPADAVVMVYGDPSSVAPAIRRDLLPALLRAIGDQQIERSTVRSLWRRMAYDGIATELLAALGDAELGDQARQAATDAVTELELRELVPALVDIAVNPSESITFRTSVLYALKQLRAHAAADRLLSLAIEPQPVDTNDELKGAALRLLWPDAMTADALFLALTPEKNEQLFGTYKLFLRSECAPYLVRPADLVSGVRWALTLPREYDSTRAVVALADIVVAKAWPLAATDDEIAEVLADLVALATQQFMPVLTGATSRFGDDAPDRALHDGAANEALIEVLVGRVVEGKVPLELLRVASLHELAYDVDVNRIIERWASATTGAERDAWLTVTLSLARGSGADALFDVKETYPELYEHVAWRYEAIRLDTPEAEAMREEWKTEQEARRLPAETQVDPAQFDQQVIAELDAFRNGDVAAYWRLQYPLMIDDDGFIVGREFRDDLTETPGWRRLPEEVRDGIADSAALYLRQGDPDPDRWVGTNTVYWPAWGGYCALKLMWKERRSAFDELDPTLWRRWAPIVVAWPNLGTEEEQSDFRKTALGIVRQLAPEEA
jgi:hypothetical protein